MRAAAMVGLAAAVLLGVGCQHAPPAGSDGATEADGLAGAAPWIRVSDNGRYFVFEDGRPFFPLGLSGDGSQLNYGAFGEYTTAKGARVSVRPDSLETQFAAMQANGQNFLRMDLEGFGFWEAVDVAKLVEEGKVDFLERPVGTFSESYARKVDDFLGLAERYGIYVDLVLVSHSCFLGTIRDDFAFYPYSAAQGGPAHVLSDFFDSQAVREAYRRRLEYVVDRWGRSPNVFAWELWNELTYCGGSASEATNAEWVQSMGEHLRSYQLRTQGRAHLVLVSPPGFVPGPAYFKESRGTDVLTTHLYSGTTQLEARPVEVALEIGQEVPRLLEEVGYRRPHVENERFLVGQTWPPALVREAEHNVAWAYLASGSAGGGAAWVNLVRLQAGSAVVPPLTEDPRLPLLFEEHRRMRPFLDALPLGSFDSRPLGGRARAADPQVTTLAVGDGSTVVGWLLRDDRLDYQVEAIEYARVKANRVANPIVLFPLAHWVRLLRGAGVEVDLSSYVDRMVAVFVAELGVTPERGRELVTALLSGQADPAAVRRHPKSDAVFRGLLVIADDLYEHLNAVEASAGVLARTYQGHPEVRTTLTLEGLADGAHRVRFFDDAAGEWLGEATFEGTRADLELPAFRKHLAFLLTDP